MNNWSGEEENRKNTASGGGGGGGGASSSIWRKVDVVNSRQALAFAAVIAVSFLLIYNSVDRFQFFLSSQENKNGELQKVLKAASMKDKTVILTTVNDAWAEPKSLMELFLESFKIGNNTQKLLRHVVIICLDEKAYARCLEVHPHCYLLGGLIASSSEAYFMTPKYLDMMWKRINFLITVLQLGYNFVFTDADVMWLQNPFAHFYQDADFQIACDSYLGNSTDRNNPPNGGFVYVKSNNRTVQFYKVWYSSREKFPGAHDQDVLNLIKFDPFIDEIGLKMRFLDTAYFGGFCQPSTDFNLVCTMHANCCFGLEAKVHDLKIVLQDWKTFFLSPPNVKASSSFTWRAPSKCSVAEFNPPP